MANTTHWDNLKTVPANALKEIPFGKLKGKSDINPQWRYEVMTKEFGMCGFGWKYEIVKTWTQAMNDGQMMLFVEVNLYVKDGEKWSEPIPAIGGDFVLEKDKNGLHGNDEAYKMATTDALGVAMKMLGVAADIYRGLANDTKYGREKQAASTTTTTTTAQHTDGKATDSQISAIRKIATVKKMDISKYDFNSMTKQQASNLIKELQVA